MEVGGEIRGRWLLREVRGSRCVLQLLQLVEMKLRRTTYLLAVAGAALLLGVLTTRHPYFLLCTCPETAVAEAVTQGDSAFLVRACQAKILPFRVRREALLGLLEFQGGTSTRVVFSDEVADAIFRKFSGSVRRESLVFLYPALVAGEINPRLKRILLDASEAELVRWSAFLVLAQEPSLVTGTSAPIWELLGAVEPPVVREKMEKLLARKRQMRASGG